MKHIKRRSSMSIFGKYRGMSDEEIARQEEIDAIMEDAKSKAPSQRALVLGSKNRRDATFMLISTRRGTRDVIATTDTLGNVAEEYSNLEAARDALANVNINAVPSQQPPEFPPDPADLPPDLPSDAELGI